jgi:hypothetical protein
VFVSVGNSHSQHNIMISQKVTLAKKVVGLASIRP